MPDARPLFKKFVFKPFGQPQGGVGVIFVTQPLIDEGGAAFDGEGGVGLLEQIVTDTRADGDAVLQIGNAVMQGIHAEITVKFFTEEMVVLSEEMGGIRIFYILASLIRARAGINFIFTIGGLPAKCPFIHLVFFLRQHARRDQ